MSNVSRPVGPPTLSAFDLETARLYGVELVPALPAATLRRGLRALSRARGLGATDKLVTAAYLAWASTPHRPPTFGELAASLDLSRSTVSLAVHRLLDAGVLRRLPPPTDGEPRGLWLVVDVDGLERQADAVPPGRDRRGGVRRGVTRQGKSAGADLFFDESPCACISPG